MWLLSLGIFQLSITHHYICNNAHPEALEIGLAIQQVQIFQAGHLPATIHVATVTIFEVTRKPETTLQVEILISSEVQEVLQVLAADLEAHRARHLLAAEVLEEDFLQAVVPEDAGKEALLPEETLLNT